MRWRESRRRGPPRKALGTTAAVRVLLLIAARPTALYSDGQPSDTSLPDHTFSPTFLAARFGTTARGMSQGGWPEPAWRRYFCGFEAPVRPLALQNNDAIRRPRLYAWWIAPKACVA